MAHVICLFNHKGGVGKTTTVFHLGWKMAQMGKRVLIVDADSQCNLTGLTLGVEDYDSLFAFYDSKKNTDVFNSLAPVFQLEENARPVSSKWGVPTKTANPNLDILAGNIRFAEMDTQIATALTSSRTLPILQPLVGAFNAMVRDIARQGHFDYVLIDMSPSISATNECILMGADYFIVPVSPDFYCYQAIDSLGKVFPRWLKDVADFREENVQFCLPQKYPKMLGFVSGNYRVYTTESNKEESGQKTMSRAYKGWLDKIKDVATQKLIPPLMERNMVISEEIFKRHVSYDAPYHLAGIQDFNQLIPVSQKLSKPIYELTSSDGNWAGAVWEYTDKKGQKQGLRISVQLAGQMYTDMAQSIFSMVEEDS